MFNIAAEEQLHSSDILVNTKKLYESNCRKPRQQLSSSASAPTASGNWQALDMDFLWKKTARYQKYAFSAQSV